MPGVIADHSRGKFVADVQSHGHVRLGKAREQAVADHGVGAADGFLGGLANQHQRSVPGVLAARHDLGGAQKRRHVQIVSAGMHHRNIASGVIFRVHFAGVGQAGFFFHGKRVQFGAQHDGRARAVLQDATTPVPPTCSVTSYPALRRRAASFAAVCVSCEESSGFWCRSR